MSKKLWGGRFNAQTHPDVEQFTASIQFDAELAYEDILGSLAHAAMLQNCQIISDEEHEQLHAGLCEIAQKVLQGEVKFRMEDEDIHMNIERMLAENIGETAGKLHTARSRNDQVALDLHLYLRRQLVFITDLLTQLQNTLLQMAKNHQQVILPGYTHLQRAQPIYIAQHWLAYVAMLQRDITRLQEIWSHVNRSPLGAAALAGTSLPINRHFVANKLGFDGIYINTLDAVSNRDFVVEFLAAAALIMMHLSRLSEELILWSSQEFNFISFDEAFCTGSSIMPQKKNPDVAELGRGKTGRVYGALFSLLTLLKGLPLTYNKDLQEDKEPLFDVIKTLRQTLAIYIPMLATLKINPDNMRQAVDDGYLNATALAEYLVKKDIPFRSAHEISGKLVNYCINKKCRLEDLSLAEIQSFCPIITDTVFQALAIETIVAAHDKGNHTRSSALQTELALQEQQLLANQTWLLEKNDLLSRVCNDFQLSPLPL